MGYFVSNEGFVQICRVDPDGCIYDRTMNRVGKIDADGFIYSADNERVGRIHKDGFIYTEGWTRLGRIRKNGEVYSENFDYLGRLDMDVVQMILGDKDESKAVKSQCSRVESSAPSGYRGYETRGGYELGQNAAIATVFAILAGGMAGYAMGSFWMGFLAGLLFDELILALLDTSWAKEHHISVFSVAGGHYIWTVLLTGLFLWFLLR